MHADTSVSPLRLRGTTPSTCHPVSLLTHNLHAHVQSVCVIKAVGWNSQLKVSAGEGRSR